ncbi:hypothetical protein BKA82DRAFT_4019290 [Pisolithus tinctorius]|nr:hypothetical protein BKA82DRAFT_4019290 [Pisolithus tinctorius]
MANLVGCLLTGPTCTVLVCAMTGSYSCEWFAGLVGCLLNGPTCTVLVYAMTVYCFIECMLTGPTFTVLVCTMAVLFLVGCLLTGSTCTVLVCAITVCLVGCLLTGPTRTVLVCAMTAYYSPLALCLGVQWQARVSDFMAGCPTCNVLLCATTGCLVGCQLTVPAFTVLVCAITVCLIGSLLTGPICTVLVCAMTACLFGCLLTGHTLHNPYLCHDSFGVYVKLSTYAVPGGMTGIIVIWMVGMPSLVLQHQVAEIRTQGKTTAPSQEVTACSIAQHGVSPNQKDVIPLAVKEYKSSGIEATIHKAVNTAVQQCGANLNALCKTLLQIILENRLCECICPVFQPL